MGGLRHPPIAFRVPTLLGVPEKRTVMRVYAGFRRRNSIAKKRPLFRRFGRKTGTKKARLDLQDGRVYGTMGYSRGSANSRGEQRGCSSMST